MRTLTQIMTILAGLMLSLAVLAESHTETSRSGEAVYEASCANCHSSFIGGFFSGAPSIGDADDWAELTPKGVDGLTASTIAGIGEMAPRGACTECTDAEIRAAVEYMLGQIE